jgi:hypothetical protein
MIGCYGPRFKKISRHLGKKHAVTKTPSKPGSIIQRERMASLSAGEN